MQTIKLGFFLKSPFAIKRDSSWRVLRALSLASFSSLFFPRSQIRSAKMYLSFLQFKKMKTQPL
eukprot:snap_masked-scaffold_64-processed-gene-0.41-mRNA-1 protein AED:1.00 eAED:1.00 QI:0/0/0/0/1/1/2/0/63